MIISTFWGQLESPPEREGQAALEREAQWFRLNECLVAFRSLEPGLRKAGYFRGEDDEDEKSRPADHGPEEMIPALAWPMERSCDL